MIIDTHCHLDFPEFDLDRDAVLERAKNAGVGCVVNVGSSLDGSRRSVELAKRFDIVFASIGVHPHYAGSWDEKALNEVKSLIKSEKVVAIGEVGLDYYRNPSRTSEQKKMFRDFLDLAEGNNLPLIIHSRDAHDDTLAILKERCNDKINGVMHCFSAGKTHLKECLDLGLFISFTCNLTFKNAKHLRELAREVPVERLLLETDAPFLAPQEFRGKRNEPAYLVHLVREWAGILNLPERDLERITTQNAKKLFKLA